MTIAKRLDISLRFSEIHVILALTILSQCTRVTDDRRTMYHNGSRMLKRNCSVRLETVLDHGLSVNCIETPKIEDVR